MTCAPSEYTGEPGTCVCGRVVLCRGPFNAANPDAQTTASSGKATGKKGKKKGDDTQNRLKTEIHILGGNSIDEVLFIDGWGDGATQLARALTRGSVYRIAGAKKVDSSPRYSTSRLPYFLRFVPPLGVATQIELYNEAPWRDVPVHHPFADFESLQGIGSSLRVSVLGVVETQTGTAQRDTKYGQGEVCNAVLKNKNHLIRCGFWRSHGADLARHPVGTALALHQVNVYVKNTGWEIAATEGTQIEECPPDLRSALLESTNLNEVGIALTTTARIDYNTVKTIPATLSGLASVIQPHAPRDLGGVFEVHSVAVLGISSVLEGQWFVMQACAKCKAQVDPDTNSCRHCTESEGVEQRWIFSLDLADQTGSCAAMLYHDATDTLPFLVMGPDEPRLRTKITRGFRSIPWTVRCVYKKNTLKDTNYVEVKKIEPTINAEGVVGSFRIVPAPQVPCNTACPFARCADVAFNKELGVTTNKGKGVAAVRLLVRVMAPAEDEVVATPDPTNQGFRVCRRAQCCLRKDGAETIYELKTAGMAASVQWLMTAPPDSCFCVTAQGRGADAAFKVLEHVHTPHNVFDHYLPLMSKHIDLDVPVVVEHHTSDTPGKRLKSLLSAVPEACTPLCLTKRKRLDSTPVG